MIPQDLYNQFLENMVLCCVDCCVMNGNEMLLVRRNTEPAKGRWWLPGGRILKGESIVVASLRKVLEETGLKAKFVKRLGAEETFFEEGPHGGSIHSINIMTLVETDSKDVVLDKYSSEHQWVKGIYEYDQIHPYIAKSMELAGMKYIRKYGSPEDPTDHVYL